MFPGVPRDCGARLRTQSCPLFGRSRRERGSRWGRGRAARPAPVRAGPVGDRRHQCALHGARGRRAPGRDRRRTPRAPLQREGCRGRSVRDGRVGRRRLRHAEGSRGRLRPLRPDRATTSGALRGRRHDGARPPVRLAARPPAPSEQAGAPHRAAQAGRREQSRDRAAAGRHRERDPEAGRAGRAAAATAEPPAGQPLRAPQPGRRVTTSADGDVVDAGRADAATSGGRCAAGGAADFPQRASHRRAGASGDEPRRGPAQSGLGSLARVLRLSRRRRADLCRRQGGAGGRGALRPTGARCQRHLPHRAQDLRRDRSGLLRPAYDARDVAVDGTLAYQASRGAQGTRPADLGARAGARPRPGAQDGPTQADSPGQLPQGRAAGGGAGASARRGARSAHGLPLRRRPRARVPRQADDPEGPRGSHAAGDAGDHRLLDQRPVGRPALRADGSGPTPAWSRCSRTS